MFLSGHAYCLVMLLCLIMDKTTNLRMKYNQYKLDNITDCEYIDADQLFRFEQADVVLNCMHINARSLLKCKSNLLLLLDNLQENNITVDVLLVCETFFNDINVSQGNLPGYHGLHKYRDTQRGGGVSVYIREDISIVRTIDTPYTCGLESISVLIRKAKLNFVVSEFYRPPNSNLHEFNKVFHTYLDTLSKVRAHVTVIGTDQNIDLLKLGHRSECNKFMDTVLEKEYEPTINIPTRVTHSTATLIDNIYIKRKLDFTFSAKVILDDISDHFPCMVSLCSKKYCTTEDDILICKRKLNSTVYHKINQDLLFADWTNLVELNVDESYNLLIDRISRSIEKHAKEKCIKVSKKSSFTEPLLSVPLLKMGSKCNKLFRKSIGKQPDSAEVNAYKNYQRSLVTLKRHERYQFYKKLFEKIGTNSKNLWSVLNGLISKSRNKHTITSICDGDGTSLLTDSNKIANSFNNHFVTAGKRVQDTIAVTGESHTTFLNYQYKKHLIFSPVTEFELSLLIEKLPSKTSFGVDHISNEMLKQIFYSIREPLTVIFNKSLGLGEFPENMKVARVVPLFKGADSLLKDNYRPISLLPVISKLLEKCVYKRLTSHMESNGHLYDKQFGFRKHHGCVDAIETFIGNVLEGFDKEMHCLSIFIDLKKAFDTVKHTVILDKLRAIGVCNTELHWFQSYMHNRRQFVDINGSYSQEKVLDTGVAQGSLLGVLLFQIIINDLYNVLKFCSAILYADDTTIYVIGRNSYFLEKKLQSDLNRVSMWLKANHLSLNVSKTKIMIFQQNSVNRFLFEIIIDGVRVDEVSNFKFLGMILDQKCDWKAHCSTLLLKLKQLNFLINRIKTYVPSGCLRDLYFAHFTSHMTYGLRLWGNSICKNVKTLIFRQQKRAVRIITKSNYYAHTDPLFKRVNILKLDDAVRLQNVKLACNIVNNNCPIALLNLFQKANTNTRNHGLIVKKHSSTVYNKSFLCQVVLHWNELDNDLKNKSFFTIKNHFRKLCLSNT